MRWPRLFRKRLTGAEKAQIASELAVSTRAVSDERARRFAATNAGLMAMITPEARARVADKLQQAARAAT